jgi:putative ABC transport system substrate-binding protein
MLLGGSAAAVWPLAAHAQRKAMPVIGLLGLASGPGLPFMAPFYQGLRENGFVEGQNVAIKYRVADLHYERFPALAADLVGHKVDVIVTGNTTQALAAKRATSTIPIVFTFVSDPVGAGLVASLARPGGNLTGFSNLTAELIPKLFELLCEMVPKARVIGLLVNPDSAIAGRMIQYAQEAAGAKGVQLQIQKARTEGEIDVAFAALVQRQVGGLVIAADGAFISWQDQLVALASRHALPVIDGSREFPKAGGLVGYGPTKSDARRQAGAYAGRILKGEKPADLPVQQPTKFELVISLKTAKALGLTVPQSLLARAEEVIE